MTPHTTRLIAVVAGLTLAFPDRHASAVNVGGTLACDTTCPTCDSCDATASADPVNSSLASIDLSFDLGGAPFLRPADFSAYHVAALANLGDRHLQQSFSSIMGYFDDAEITNLWRSELRLKTDTITAATFNVASLEYNHAQKMEVIKVGGVIRQVLTYHFLVDVQELASPAEGFELKWYFAADKGAKSGGLYGLPGGTPVKHVTVSNPTPATYTTVDVHSLMKTPNASQRKIHTRYVFETNSTTGRLEHHMETWTDKPAETGATKIEVVTLDYLAGTPASNAKDYVRSLSRADLSAAGAYGSLTLISRIREKWSDIAGKSLMTEKIRLSGTGSNTAGLKTTYGYYSGTGNTLIDGHRRWQKNYDGSWIVWDVTATQTSQTVKEIRPFEDGATFVLADDGSNVGSVAETEAFVTQTTTTGSQMTEVRSALGQQIGKTEKAFLTGSGGERIKRVREFYTATAYFETYKAFNAYGNGTAANAGRLAWETHQDGTATTYTYSLMGSDLVVTRRSGATTGTGATSTPVISAGSQSIRSYNEFREIYSEAESDIESGLTTTFWTGSDADLYGRPEKVEYNGNAGDFMTVTRTCCGPTETRDRTGAVNSYAYDLLKRQHRTVLKRSSTSTEIVTTTTRTGLTTKVERSDGTVTLLVSESTGSMDGLTIATKSPDANGDTLPETTSREIVFGVGTTTTTTYPDTTQKISATYRDGSPKSSTDQEDNVASYSNGVHAEQGGGLWSKTTTPVSTQWTKTYADHLGRSFKTEFPDGAISTVGYYGASDPSGSRGKVAAMTDPDENDTANTGSKVTYGYNAEGEQTTTAELIADGHTRTTVTATSVVNNTESGIGTASKSTSTVNSVLVSTNYSSVDGYRSKNVSFGRISSSTRTVASNGVWTETSTTANGQRTVQTYLKGRLDNSEYFDNQATPVSIASTAYTYDDLDRTLTTVDSRTGTTTIGGYLENGAVTSVVTNGGSDSNGYSYNVMGRTLTVTLPDNSVTNTSYTPRGQVRATWGSQTHPQFNEYDALGRRSKLHTWQTAPALTQATDSAPAGSAVTEWLYNGQRGWLVEKNHDGETDNGIADPDYTYTLAGRLKIRTWERGVVTTYGYDRGMLESVNYSDTTPDVGYTYDAFGRPRTATQGSGGGANTTTYAYKDDGNGSGGTLGTGLGLHSEAIGYGASGLSRTLLRHEDSLLRPAGYQLKNGAGVDHATAYGYDFAGRLKHVDPSYPLPTTPAFAYGFEDDSIGLVGTVTGPAHTATNGWEPNRDVLDTKTNADLASTPVTISSFNYGVNNLGQRTGVLTSGSAFSGGYSLGWAYNDRGEMEEEDFGANQTSEARDRAFLYDEIGNREKTANGLLANLPATPNYAANALNQYTTANGITISTTPAPYDADGNGKAWNIRNPLGTSSLASCVFTWDAENRLTEVKDSGGNVIASYAYDFQSRRIRKTVAGGEDVAFFYNGWNCIAEYQVGTSTPKARYIWGLDLSGSMQGAGGVGGLLVVTNSAGSYYPTYDGNGNVSEYVNSSGASVAHFEYDAFGNVVNFTESSAGVAASFRHRFSTKPQDNETGLLYYGYRYFDPVTGRWPSRDPIGERGGKNLYGFVFNSPLGFIDLLGSAPLQIDVNSEIWRKIPREIQIRILNDKLGRVIVPGPNTGNIVDDIASVLAWIQSYEESGEDVPDYVTDRLDDLVDLSQLPPFQNSCKCCNPETGEVVETMEFWEKEGMESFDSCVDKNLKHGWVRQMRTAMSAASRASVVVVVGGASITKVIKTIKTCNKIRRIVQIASVVGTVATIAEWAGEKAYNDDVEQASEKCGKCVCPDGFLLECGRTTNYNY